MNKVLIKQLIYMNAVKYDRLSQIVNTAFANSNSSALHIYIDLNSILKSLYRAEYDIKDYSVLSAYIINLCAHYREFFERKPYEVKTDFYLIYSPNCPILNKQLYYGYNSKFEKQFVSNNKIRDMITHNIKLLNILCPYLPDIYFINGTYETGVIIKDIINRNGLTDSTIPNLVITKDVYNYQLVQGQYLGETIILRPKKVEGIDTSYFINYDNVKQFYLLDRGAKLDSLNDINADLLSVIMALTSVPQRSISTLTSITKAKKALKIAIDNKLLSNSQFSNPDLLWNIIKESIDPTLPIDAFSKRFRAIDIWAQSLVYYESQEAKSLQFLNLVDTKSLHNIVDDFFKTEPIDLERL